MSALIGIVGDVDPAKPTHVATEDALRELEVRFEWIPTESEDGEARIVELADHPFFVSTLFVFQAGRRSACHPLLRGFVAACEPTATR